MKNRYYVPELENLEVGEEILSNLDVDNIFPENLLFQAGYLTIKDYRVLGSKNVFKLSYTNFEVRMSFNDAFLTYIVRNLPLKDRAEINLITAIQEKNIDKLKDVLYSFFAGIPHDWYRNNDIASYEGFYSSVVYALFNSAGLEIRVEDSTNVGRIDVYILSEDTVYILEFKVVEDKEEYKALKQIKEKRYYEKYKDKKVYLIGIEFSKEKKNIVSFEWESLTEN